MIDTLGLRRFQITITGDVEPEDGTITPETLQALLHQALENAWGAWVQNIAVSVADKPRLFLPEGRG